MVSYVSVGVVVVVLALTGFFATILRVSVFILRGLKFYVLPEDSAEKSSASKSAAPEGHGSSEKEAEAASGGGGGEKLKKPKGGKKKKDKDVFDEGGAQILRLRMENAQLESRKYFKEYDESVIYSLLGLASFATREVLLLMSNSGWAKQRGWTEALTPDDRVSFMVSLLAVLKLLRVLAKVSYDPQLARRSERLLNWVSGVVGFVLASAILLFVPTSIVDFGINDAVVDAGRTASLYMQKKGAQVPNDIVLSANTVKLMLASTAAICSTFLSGPTLRNAKAFWVATDQVGWNISLLKRSSLVRPLLNLAVVLPLLVTMLWVKPILPLVHPTSSKFGSGDVDFSVKPDEVEVILGHPQSDLSRVRDGGVDFSRRVIENGQDVDEAQVGTLGGLFLSRERDWAEGWGVSDEVFGGVRLWGLFLVAVLQVALLRVNVQTYSDGSVLVWYQSLHESRAHNPEVTKAKIFLNNYFICRIAVQSLVPGVIVVLMLGLARSKGAHMDNLREGEFFFAPSFVRAIMHFLSWWFVFVPSLQSWVILALFRWGLLTNTF